MAFLSSTGGLPDFTKVVISLWFRVPQESIDACATEAEKAKELERSGDYSGVNALLSGIIPLVTFGVKGERRQAVPSTGKDITLGTFIQHIMVLTDDGANWREEPAGYLTDPTGPGSPVVNFIQSPSVPTLGAAIAMNPSCIGINCSTTPPTLYLNFETGKLPDVMSGFSVASAAGAPDLWTYTWPGWSFPDALALIPEYTGNPDGENPTYTQNYFSIPRDWKVQATDFTDVSWLLHNSTASYGGGSGIVVTPDQWHHVLVSVDVLNGSSVNDGVVAKASKMWVAFDDKNYTGTTMSGSNPSGGGPNDVLASGAFAFIGMVHPPEDLGAPYSYAASANIAGGGVGIPSFGDLSESVRKVQMAELQIFTGVTLDTSIEENRRAFINSKGQPVDEAYGVAKYRGIYGPKSPNVTPSAPVKLLGKRPDVAIVRSARNWISGFDFNKTSFRPQGKILPVRPDPVLGK